MGREAECAASAGGDRGHVKALLEAKELILRGAIRRRWLLADLNEVRVVEDRLCLRAGDECVELMLGEAQAASWARKIAAPAPSLSAKLGLGSASRAFVIGALADAELVAALDGCITTQPEAAALCVAVVLDAQALEAALEIHAGLPGIRPLWLVYPKGRDSTLPDGVVREHLRAAGYVDSKSTAVSDRLTATRYARR
jgi:hypothetical protein